MAKAKVRRYKKIIITTVSILLSLFIVLLFFVNRFIEPILLNRLHTLIIQGSDSLYTYTLGKLSANFYGGNVEVENLQIKVDSNRYQYLRSRNALPALTMQLSLKRGRIRGVGIIALLFEKKIKVEEIMSGDADIQLTRHVHQQNKKEEKIPVWKAIQPTIKSIYVGRIQLTGIKLSYKNIDTSESVKLQFDRCDALFKNIQVDSVSSTDTSRISFTKSVYMQFSEFKFRTQDSMYKMKAKRITYSSEKRTLEVDSFNLQPTLSKEDFYKTVTTQKSLYNILFDKVRFVNTRLDHFIHNNIIDADSVLFEKPDIAIYNDRSLPLDYESKIGKYPQQQLLNAASTIIIKNITVKNARLVYTEKNGKTAQEGTLALSNMQLSANNITNDSLHILQNKTCTANLTGTILGSSPFAIAFRFYLDSTNGRYDASGSVQNVTAAELNPLALSMANVQINSFNMHNLDFQVRGEDYNATASVRMRYNDLSLTFRKTNAETGETTTKKFLTKLLYKYVIWPNNPGSDGKERISQNKKVARLTTEPFFGLLWKTIFAGMQNIMLRSGRYE